MIPFGDASGKLSENEREIAGISTHAGIHLHPDARIERHFLRQRESHDESDPAAGAIFGGDRSAVRFHNTAGDG